MMTSNYYFCIKLIFECARHGLEIDIKIQLILSNIHTIYS